MCFLVYCLSSNMSHLRLKVLRTLKKVSNTEIRYRKASSLGKGWQEKYSTGVNGERDSMFGKYLNIFKVELQVYIPKYITETESRSWLFYFIFDKICPLLLHLVLHQNLMGDATKYLCDTSSADGSSRFEGKDCNWTTNFDYLSFYIIFYKEDLNTYFAFKSEPNRGLTLRNGLQM